MFSPPLYNAISSTVYIPKYKDPQSASPHGDEAHPLDCMLRFPGPLVHGEGGGEGLQQDVVEHAGEEGEGEDDHRQQWRPSPLWCFLLHILLLPESLEFPLSDVVLPEDHGQEQNEADQACGRTDPS